MVMKEMAKHYEAPSVTVVEISEFHPVCSSPGSEEYGDKGMPGFDKDHTRNNNNDWVI